MLAGAYTETILCLPKTDVKTSKYKEFAIHSDILRLKSFFELH